jgi:hypothetical protein
MTYSERRDLEALTAALKNAIKLLRAMGRGQKFDAEKYHSLIDDYEYILDQHGIGGEDDGHWKAYEVTDESEIIN